MRSRLFAGTGASLSVVGLGAMPLSIEGRPDESAAKQVVHAALDAGMTWLETADAYCLDDGEIGYGERLLARAVKEIGRDARIATKGGYRRPGGAWRHDGRPARLREACEASLAALGVESVFLYQLHAPDPEVPFADSVGALADLRREGKIQHIGLCNVDVRQIAAALRIAPIASVQNLCNVFELSAFDEGVVALCEREWIAFIAHSPVGGHQNHRRLMNHARLLALGAKLGLTAYQVAIAWLVGASPAIFAIPGASRPESARASARAGGVVLSAADRREIEGSFPLTTLLREARRMRRRASRMLRSARKLARV
jgi:aryl-alcohol dehydrogenase-like predicted oxidoreductase